MLETIALKRKLGTRKDYDQIVTACCQECTIGCGLLAYVKDERIVDIQGDERHPVSQGRLCANGIAFVQGLLSPDRITLPGTRNRLNAPFEAFDNWEKGIDLLAERLRRVKEQHGAESLVIGCDPEAGLDFYLGALRFARLWGTPHIYHPLQETADPLLPETVRHPVVKSHQWRRNRCLMLMECDLAVTHPVLFQRVLKAQKEGATVIAVDSRFTATLSKADIAVQIAPNRGNELGLALTKILLESKHIDTPAGKAKNKAFQQWAKTFTALNIGHLSAAIKTEEEKIRAIANCLGHRQPAVIITAKRLAFQDHYGIWLTLADAMGWQESENGGWYPMVSGSPQLDPTVDLKDVQPAVDLCNTLAMPYQSSPSGQAALDGLEIKALIGSGNCLSDFLAPLQKRISDVDLAVYFGSFPNQTRQAAHMVFPATIWPERANILFTNDGAVQWSPRIVKPSDACRTGLGFWMRLAQRFGWEEHFPWIKANGLADHKAFYQWLFEKNPETVHLAMDQIETQNMEIYWQKDITAKQKVTHFPAPKDVSGPTDEDNLVAYPFLFQTTRTGSQAGAISNGWPRTQESEAHMGIQLHPTVAEALSIETGESIIVASNDEIIEGSAMISRMVPPWLVWSRQRIRGNRVLVYRKGQAPEEARDRLKVINL